MNRYVTAGDSQQDTLAISAEATRRQLDRLNDVRGRRDAAAVGRALDALESAARGDANLMPPILEAVHAYASVGEICDRLRKVFGEYQESTT